MNSTATHIAHSSPGRYKCRVNCIQGKADQPIKAKLQLNKLEGARSLFSFTGTPQQLSIDELTKFVSHIQEVYEEERQPDAHSITMFRIIQVTLKNILNQVHEINAQNQIVKKPVCIELSVLHDGIGHGDRVSNKPASSGLSGNYECIDLRGGTEKFPVLRRKEQQAPYSFSAIRKVPYPEQCNNSCLTFRRND